MSYPVDINDLAYEIHETAKAKGFWDHGRLVVRDPVTGDVEGRPENPSIVPEKLALIHSEVSEALEAWRDGDYDHLDEELADVVIRVLDLSEQLRKSDKVNNVGGFRQRILWKKNANKERPRLHGRKR